MKSFTSLAGLLSTGLLLSASAFAANGDLVVYQQSVSPCNEQQQSQGKCDMKDEEVFTACMTYKNTLTQTQLCDLKGSALLEEPETGFTKEVIDIRQEKLFFNQTHNFCFNFKKDVYNLWKLKKISKPTYSCVPLVSGQEPKDECDVAQGTCDKPAIDTTAECSPYDWTCS